MMNLIQQKINGLKFEIAELKVKAAEWEALCDESNEIMKRFVEDTQALEKENKELKEVGELSLKDIKFYRDEYQTFKAKNKELKIRLDNLEIVIAQQKKENKELREQNLCLDDSSKMLWNVTHTKP